MKVSPELFNVEILECYTWGDSVEKFNELQCKFKGVSFLTLADFDPDESHTQYVISERELVLSKEQILELAINNIKTKVKQKIVVDVDITKQLIELAEKPIKLIQENNEGATYNSKCEVHMPGHSLSMYNETLLLEDSCTDILQSSLNSGWRIIAACPQPDNRRPDYILGRFNPNFEADGSAERRL